MLSTKFNGDSLISIFMSIPEITCSLTVSNRLVRILLRNLDYCLLLKYASDRLELLISVYLIECLRRYMYFLIQVTYFKY